MSVEIKEIDISIHSTRCESHIIFKPVNATDSVGVTSVLHCRGTVARIEIVNMNAVGLHCSRKQVTAMGEPDFCAVFHSYLFEMIQTFAKNVTELNLVSHCHQNVKSTWMESYSKNFLCELVS